MDISRILNEVVRDPEKNKVLKGFSVAILAQDALAHAPRVAGAMRTGGLPP